LTRPCSPGRRAGRSSCSHLATPCRDRSTRTTFVEDLASHGFVVVAIDHPYSVAIVVLPDGRTAIQAGSGAPVVPFETRVGVHAADLRFALDEMTRLDSAPTT
jgi:hypothetical protein